jgi:hypothetical protein
MKIVTIIVTTLILAGIITGQEDPSTQAQRVVLNTPEVITLKLAPVARRARAGVYQEMSGPFNAESKIQFALVGTNTSLLPLTVRRWDHYAQNRPRLLRDNQEVAYRKGVSELLKSKDRENEDIVNISVITLEPSNEKTLENLDMKDWYDPLKPGHYQLSAQHRFVQGGKWVDSASVTFEVKTKDSQQQ